MIDLSNRDLKNLLTIGWRNKIKKKSPLFYKEPNKSSIKINCNLINIAPRENLASGELLNSSLRKIPLLPFDKPLSKGLINFGKKAIIYKK